ncbi:hypothetical protein ACRW3C_10935, partial [Escherichia coli]
GEYLPGSLQGKISSDGCLKKEQMVVSAIASTPHIIYNPQALLFSRLYIPHLPFFLTRAGTTLSSF